MAQILDGILKFSGWVGSAGMDAVMLSMMAKMKAQLAGLFTVSAVNPYEMFSDIVDGIEDIGDPADIAGKLEELEFTQTEVNKAIFRFIAHIKKAHNYKVSHNTLAHPLGLDDYENLIFTQSIGLENPPRFDDNEGISTLMYGKTGINNNLYLVGDKFYNATFNELDLLPAHDYFTNKTSLSSSLNSKQDNLILGNKLSLDVNKNLQVDLDGLQEELTFFHSPVNENNLISIKYDTNYFDLIDSKLSIKSSVLDAKQNTLTHIAPFDNTNNTITLNLNTEHFNLTNNKLNLINTIFYNKEQFLTDYGANFKFDTGSFTETKDENVVTTYSVTGGTGSGSVWTKSDNNDISYTAGNIGIGTSLQETKLSVYGTDTENANLEILASFSSKKQLMQQQVLVLIVTICYNQTLKSGIIHERLESYGRGSLHICNNNEASITDFTMNDVKLTITNGQNVGIGISPDTDYMLNVHTTGETKKGLKISNKTQPLMVFNDDHGNRLTLGYRTDNTYDENNISSQILKDTTGNINYYSRTNHTASHIFYTNNGIQRMKINPTSGNVGIGGNGNFKLDVNGDINTTGIYKINCTDITTDDITESTSKKYLQWTKSDNDISYTAGNVGIGILNPSSFLHIYAEHNAALLIEDGGSAVNQALIVFKKQLLQIGL
ncbi:hypothetical protein T484DRAFT_3640972 [Baffinella frigidus]|nr:hypothetical protein T484DRAFT_3640972 [Cryptophyta sp. CCMP2293]